jgi:hypothetical protein
MSDLNETEQAYVEAIERLLERMTVVELDQAQARVNDTLIPALAKLLHVLMIRPDSDLYNYVEWDVGVSAGGVLRLTLQRVSGKTPSDLYREAQAERDRLLSLFRDVRTFLEASVAAPIAARNKVLFVSLPILCDEALGDKLSGHEDGIAAVRAYLDKLRPADHHGAYYDGLDTADLRGGDDA